MAHRGRRLRSVIRGGRRRRRRTASARSLRAVSRSSLRRRAARARGDSTRDDSRLRELRARIEDTHDGDTRYNNTRAVLFLSSTMRSRPSPRTRAARPARRAELRSSRRFRSGGAPSPGAARRASRSFPGSSAPPSTTPPRNRDARVPPPLLHQSRPEHRRILRLPPPVLRRYLSSLRAASRRAADSASSFDSACLSAARLARAPRVLGVRLRRLRAGLRWRASVARRTSPPRSRAPPKPPRRAPSSAAAAAAGSAARRLGGRGSGLRRPPPPPRRRRPRRRSRASTRARCLRRSLRLSSARCFASASARDAASSASRSASACLLESRWRANAASSSRSASSIAAPSRWTFSSAPVTCASYEATAGGTEAWAEVGDETGSARALSSARAPTVASNRAMMASTSSGEAGLGAPSPGRTSPPEAPSRGAGDDVVSRRRLSASSSDVIAKAPPQGPRSRASGNVSRTRGVSRATLPSMSRVSSEKRGDASGQDSRQPLGFEILGVNPRVKFSVSISKTAGLCEFTEYQDYQDH